MTQPAVNLESIPATLRARAQWGLWRVEKGTKVPYQATAPRRAESDNAQTWTTYARAQRAYRPGRDAGLAYFFSPDDGLTGIDLDECRDPETGALSDAARALLDTLDSYAEVSPSGTGVKVWVLGKLPRSFRATAPAPGIARIEVYSDRRFFAVTGQRLADYPAEPQERQDALDALAARYGRPERAQAAQSGQQPADRAPEWARRKLASAVQMVALARDGEKHDVLLKAARLAGGVAELADDEIARALMGALGGRAEDERGALQTIRDGIAYGRGLPLAPPATPGALVWREGVPHCPSCDAEARPSKFYEDGLYCACQRPALVWRGQEAAPPPGTAAAPGPRAAENGAGETVYVSGPTVPHGITSLTDTPPPPVVWFAPGFVREGLGLIVGQPNVGKTPLAVQLALAAAGGVPWLGAVAVQPVKVLYLGVEYSRQELYPLIVESAQAMRLKIGRDITDENFAYKTQDDALPDSPDAAIADLEFYIALGYKLILIDTLTAFLPPEKFKQNVYRGDYKELQPYHRLALRYSVAILGVWHASKREADPKLMYNGSTGMWAVPSSRISMYEDADARKRISSFPRLGDPVNWALTQEKTMAGRRWIVADVTPEPAMGPQEQVIYRWLRENASKATPKSPATVAEMTNLPAGGVRTVLMRMFDKNLITRTASGGGYYVEIADVADVARVAGVAPVADVADDERYTCSADVAGADGVETPQNAPATSATSFSRADPLAPIPAAMQTSLRLYVRAGDVTKARELCERYGADWAAVAEVLRRAA